MSPRGLDRLMTLSTEARLIGAGVLAIYISWRNQMIDFAMLEAPVEVQPLMLAVSLIAAVVAVLWVGGYSYQEYLKEHGKSKKDEPYSKQYLGADVLAVAVGVIGGMLAPGAVIQWFDIVNAGTLGWALLGAVCAVVIAVCADYILHFGVQRFFTNVKKIAGETIEGVESITELKRGPTPVPECGEEGTTRLLSVAVLRRLRKP